MKETKIKKVCKVTKNQVWHEVYSNLLKCKQNLVRKDPMNVLLCTISGEPDIMKKNTQYTADWAKGLRVLDIIDTHSKFRTTQEIPMLG